MSAIVVDIGDDYIDAGNNSPNGWQYLTSKYNYRSSSDWLLGGNRSLGDAGGKGFSTSDPGRGEDSMIMGGNGGGSMKIWNDSPNNAIKGTDILMQPGYGSNDKNFVVLRYKVKASDLVDGTTAKLNGSFRSLYNNNKKIRVGIVHNFSNIWEQIKDPDFGKTDQLTMEEGTFNLSLDGVKAGDEFNFYVTTDGDYPDGVETALRGMISFVPEPSTYALGLGLVALGWVIGRRRLVKRS